MFEVKTAGGYRSGGLEKAALKGELSGDVVAGGYRSMGLKRAVHEGELSGDIAAGGYRSRGYRSRGLEKAVLGRELSREAEECTQRRARSGRDQAKEKWAWFWGL